MNDLEVSNFTFNLRSEIQTAIDFVKAEYKEIQDLVVRVNEAINKSKNKAEKEKLTADKQNLMVKGKELAATNQKLNSLISNKLQPAPEIVEEEHKVNKEVINEDLKPNQIKIKLTGSDTLRAANATYVKYHF